MKRRIVSLFVLVGSVGVAACLAAWHPWSRSMLDRAKAVANCKGWHEYVWLSDHEFLLIREGEGHKYKVIDVDTVSRRRMSLLSLAARLSSFNYEGIIASPDGKWLLCLPFDGEPDAHIVSVDGARMVTVTVNGNTKLGWARDSGRWFEVKCSEKDQNDAQEVAKFFLRDLDDPGWISELKVSPALKVDNDSWWSSRFTVSTKDRLMISETSEPVEPSQDCMLSIIEGTIVGSIVKPAQLATVTIVGADNRPEYAISPDESHIAWVSETHGVSWWRQWMGRIFPKWRGEDKTDQFLHLAGISPRRVSEISVTTLGPNWPNVSSLGWLPDGKRISFFCKDRLWILPVG